ncbi:MAG: nucleotidyltransferase family protein [Candidatus Omnitrophica bacterium]|nr:nucleotidyltransferase family protein [Candidatus Omnitrophota bacterium]
MDKLEKIKYSLKEHKNEIREKFNVREIGIFGSYIRHDYKKNSDLDILVEFDVVPGLFAFIRLKEYLSQLTGVKVDLVMKRVLKPYIGKNILREVMYL